MEMNGVLLQKNIDIFHKYNIEHKKLDTKEYAYMIPFI